MNINESYLDVLTGRSGVAHDPNETSFWNGCFMFALLCKERRVTLSSRSKFEYS